MHKLSPLIVLGNSIFKTQLTSKKRIQLVTFPLHPHYYYMHSAFATNFTVPYFSISKSRSFLLSKGLHHSHTIFSLQLVTFLLHSHYYFPQSGFPINNILVAHPFKNLAHFFSSPMVVLCSVLLLYVTVFTSFSIRLSPFESRSDETYLMRERGYGRYFRWGRTTVALLIIRILDTVGTYDNLDDTVLR